MTALKTRPIPAKCPHCFGRGLVPNHGEVGAKMRRIREKAGLSIKAVADQMEITGGYLSDLERGKRVWTLPLRDKFENACSLASRRKT